MKPANFDFRIWDKTKEAFLKQEPTLIKLDNERVIAGRISRFYANTADIADMFIGGNDLEIELWSGMRDKNGKKIYEGDIIKISPKEAYIKQRLKENPFYLKGATLLVEFHIKDTFGFCFWGNEEKTGKALHPLDFWQKLYHYKEFGEDFEIEILGNIHENKDLLE